MVAAADPPASDSSAKSPTKVDQATLELARTQFEAGKLVEAEKLLRQVLAAIDAGQMPANQTGRCLGPLTSIYRAWGRNEDALKIALRYRKFISELSALDPTTRNQLLDQNTSDLTDILAALDRPTEAEQYLQTSLTEAEKHSDVNPQRTLTLLVRLAQLADQRSNQQASRERWQKVIDLSTATAKKIEARQMPADFYAECLTDLAAAYVSLDNRPEAIQTLTRQLKTQTAAAEQSGKSTAAQESAAKTRLLLGTLCAESGQLDQAIEVFQQALAAQRKTAPGTRAFGRDAGLIARAFHNEWLRALPSVMPEVKALEGLAAAVDTFARSVR